MLLCYPQLHSVLYLYTPFVSCLPYVVGCIDLTGVTGHDLHSPEFAAPASSTIWTRKPRSTSL